MKRFQIITAALLSVLTSCSKVIFLSKEPFTIEIPNVQSKTAWVDIVPETNDFSYYLGVIPVKEFEYKYSSNANLCVGVDAELKASWEKYFKEDMPFSDFALCNGSYLAPFYELEPETEYYAFAFPYDDKDRPVDKVVKVKFFTKVYKESDINFSVTLDGSQITVTPTNNDPYYWEWDDRETIENDYFTPKVFYYCCLEMYEQFGFMDTVLSQGQDGEDMAPYYEKMNPGDQFYLVAAGYSDGTNSDLHVYSLTYVGEGLPGKVEEVDTGTLYESSIPSSHISQGSGRRFFGLSTPLREPLSVHRASSSIHSRPL